MVTNMKNSSLLRKVDAFEKMATYGERSSFLKSLGEEPLGPGLFESPDQAIVGKPPLAEDIKTGPWAGKVNKKIDPKVQAALNKLFSLSLKTDGDLGPQTAQALQLYKNKYHDARHIYDPAFQKDVILQGDLSAMPAVAKVTIPLFEKLATPEVPFFLTLAQGANPPVAPVRKAAPDPMIQRVQEALNKMKYADSNGSPLKEDGVLGPNTQFAINNYVSKNKLTGDKNTIYNAIREAAEKTPSGPSNKAIVAEEARKNVIGALPNLISDTKLGPANIAWLTDIISPIMSQPLSDTNLSTNISALTKMQKFLTNSFRKNPQNTAIPTLLRQLNSQISEINKMT
jgi:peptidoglycan hydrolase-like protein with peptidoglycan-binding domain